jgi:hypothetical protein
MTALGLGTIHGVSFLLDETLFPLSRDAVAQFEAASNPPTAQKKRDTKRIGDISEAHALVALTEAGYFVSKPVGENARYDFIADDGVKLWRIQVKTGRLRRGVVQFNCYSSHAHRGGPGCRPYFGQVDFIAVYCPQTRKMYLVPESDLVASKAHLRIAPTRNGQSRTVRWAAEYELP